MLKRKEGFGTCVTSADFFFLTWTSSLRVAAAHRIMAPELGDGHSLLGREHNFTHRLLWEGVNVSEYIVWVLIFQSNQRQLLKLSFLLGKLFSFLGLWERVQFLLWATGSMWLLYERGPMSSRDQTRAWHLVWCHGSGRCDCKSYWKFNPGFPYPWQMF